jgi:pimeloyl-ACP methyl ester carboxylesterase
MALLSVNAATGADGHLPARDWTLDAALGALPLGRPATILVHGYRFCPFRYDKDPHRHILSVTPRSDCWKAVSWPRHLHLDRTEAGLGIGFGWQATGALPRVAARARTAGGQLGRLIAGIHRARPDVPVQVFAHSLGARVALAALETAPAGVIRRMILMSGAEYRSAAARALALPAAAHIEILNVTSRENAPFDLMFRLASPPPTPFDHALSAGLRGLPGCIDLAIDEAHVHAALQTLGYRLRPPHTRICHWSGYMRPGLFAVYRRMLDPGDRAFPAALAAALAAQNSPSGEQRAPIPRIRRGMAVASWPGRSEI